MSSYAHLSDPDPELAAHLKQHPPLPFSLPNDIAAAQQGWIQHNQPRLAAVDKGRLRSDAKYRVQDYTVPVEGGEIVVRAVIPGTGDDGLSYPLLFWMHGGGFIFGNVDLDDYLMRNLSTELQVTTLNVDYRVAPGHLFPVQLDDSFSALKWAIANADSLSISPKEKGVILGGCSAGATLAAGLAIRARDDPFLRDTHIIGQYLSCPLLVHIDAYPNFPNELLSMEQNKDAPGVNKAVMAWVFDTVGASATDPEMSPVLASSHANLPPAFFQVCGLDPLRDEAFLYDRLLREAGCKTLTKVYPGLPHAFAWEYPELQASKQYQLDVRTGLRWLLHRGDVP